MHRALPYPASWTVRRALDAYLAENGFTFEAYDAAWTDASFLGIRFRVPNTKRHRWGLMRHDLHHVATGYGTDLIGEGEVSAWEVRCLGPLGPYVASLVLTGTVLGFALAPRRALAAFRARGTPLWQADVAYEQLLAMTVGELRTMLGVPEHGLAVEPRGFHTYAPTHSHRTM